MLSRFRQQKPLSRAARERRHLVRYLGAGQARFATQKRHLNAENMRWRIYLITIFIVIIAAGICNLLREVG